MQLACESFDIRTKLSWGSAKRGEIFEDSGVHERTVFKLILWRSCETMWTELILVRRMTSGRLFSTQ